MKRTYLALTLIVLLTSFAAAGTQYINTAGANQSIGNSNNLFIDNTNTRVGVGTATPTVLFDVRTSGNNAIPSLSTVPNTAVTALFGNTGTNGVLAIGQDNAAHAWLQGRSRLGDGSSEAILLNPLGGNIGIGTTSPTYILDVNGTAGINSTLAVGGAITGYSTLTAAGITSSNGLTVSSGTVTLPANSISATYIANSAINSTKINASNTPSNGQILIYNSTTGGFTWTSASTGTVTSVALAAPTQFSVSGSPVTSTGTLTLNWSTQTANTILAGPTNGAAAAPTFRALVDNDVPDTITISGGTLGSNTISAASAWTLGSTLNIDSSTLYIDGTNNRVGIGTASPQTTFEVAGAANTIPVRTSGLIQDASGVLSRNLVTSSSWTIGEGSVGIFSANGNTTESVREWGAGPQGDMVLLWKAVPDASNSAEGGWTTSYLPINNTKLYRLSVWIKKTGTANGTTYFGTYGSGAPVLSLANVSNGNPYFWNGDLPQLDRWYLLVAYVHPSDDNTTTNYGAIYDGETGKKVQSITDFKFNTTTTALAHRVYLYYESNTNDRQYMWDPRMEEVYGIEPTIEALLGLPQSNSYGVYYGTGAVLGIGTNTPTYSLDVAGNAQVTGGLSVSGGAINSSAGLTVSGGTVSLPTGSITSTMILDGTVANADLANAVVNSTKLNASNTPTAGQVLTYNSTTGGFTWVAANTGSVTSVAQAVAGTTAVTVSGSPVTTSGTLTLTFQNATGSQDGLLKSADWTTFNNKVGATRAINTGNGLTGGGDLSADRTINISAPTCSAGTYLQWNGTAFVCTAIGTSSSGSGWTNTTTTTSTILDVNIDSGTLYVNSTANKTGIGTITPGTTLEVNTGGANAAEGLALVQTGGGNSARLFFSNGTSANAYTMYEGGSNLIFAYGGTVGSSSGTTQATLSSAGNLGIEGYIYDITQGTLTVNDDLQINGNDILDSAGSTRISLGATNSITGALTVSNGFTVSAGTVDFPANSIPGDDLADNTVDSTEIENGTLLAADLLSGNAATNGYVLAYNSSSGGFYWTSTAAGTLTQINTGDGLTGGPITTTGTISINATTCGAGQYTYWNGTAWLCGTDDDNPDSDAEIPDAITVSGGTLGSNTVSSGATFTTAGTWTLGDNGDNIVVSATNWDVDSSGNAVLAGDLDVAGGDITSANVVTSDTDATLPHIVLDSSSAGDTWLSQGAYISLGESGALGSAATHLTYVGDGYGYVGTGTVTNGTPAGGYWRFTYNSQQIYTPAAVQTGALTATTLNTGQGAYELYAMNQNVQTTDAVTFATVNTGQGANELYAMDQNVRTTDAVEFASVEKTYVTGASGLRVINNPDGGYFTANAANLANAIRIDFPVNATNTMTYMVINGFEYDTDASWQLLVGGYTHTSGWINEYAVVTSGNPPFSRVRFGSNGTKLAVVLGTVAADGAASDFDYPKIWISQIGVGYSGVTNTWESGWSMTNVSDLSDLTFTGDEQSIVTWNARNDGASSGLDADLLDGQSSAYYQPASTALTTATSFSGDVSGAYNNLQLGAGAVASADIASGAINSTKLSVSNTPSAGQILAYNSTSGGFYWTTDANAGGTMNNWLLAASGTAGTQSVTDGTTVNITAGSGISATRSGSNITISASDTSATNELQNIFQTISTTSGTAPVADSTTDTLTLTAGGGITVTGDSSTDTVTIANSGDTTADTIADDGTISDAEASDALTVSGGTLGSNTISSGSTWTTAGTLTVGDNGDNIVVSATNWDVDASGNIAAAGALSGTTLNTGQGAYELYAMDQNVRTTDTPTFGKITTTSTAHFGKSHVAVVDYAGTTTPTNGYLINTSIPYTSSSHMPFIEIEGFPYGSASPMKIDLVWYVFNGAFTNAGYTNIGAWDPGTVSLANNSGYVSIHFSTNTYYTRFTVRAYENMGSSNSWFEGWTVSDAATPATNKVTVAQKNLNTSITGNAGSVTNGLYTTTSFSGDVSGTYNNLQLGTGAVASADIASGAINSTKLQVSNTPSADQVLAYNSTSGGFYWTTYSSAGGNVSSTNGTAGYIARFTNSTNIATGALYDDGSGKIGVRTTSPAAALHVYEGGESTTQTVFTQAVTNAGILIDTDYTNNAFTPGVFWRTNGADPTKPKAGIYLRENGSGTYMYLGTSSSYVTGITNNGIIIDPSGNVAVAGTLTAGGNTVWNAGNDGSGSGLDADTLDGVSSASFLRDDAAGDWELASSTNGSLGYTAASLELREATFGASSSYTAPRLSFHWGGVVASQIGLESTGRIAILNNPGTGYENLVANNIYGSNFVDTDNTAYQVNPASTSVLNIVTAYNISSPSGSALSMMTSSTDDTTYEYIGYFSGATRQGVLLYDGSWSGCSSSTSEFCIRAENSNDLTLKADTDNSKNVNVRGTNVTVIIG